MVCRIFHSEFDKLLYPLPQFEMIILKANKPRKSDQTAWFRDQYLARKYKNPWYGLKAQDLHDAITPYSWEAEARLEKQ